jgi:uncharacterized protein YukE
MATVARAKTKSKSKSKKVTSISIRENAKKDHSPKWDGTELMTPEQYTKHFHESMKYYNMESSGKELKPKVIDWMGRNGYDKDIIQSFKKTEDWRCHVTMGAIAASLIKGMPDVKKGFNKDRSTVAWLKNSIDKVIEAGKNDVDVVMAENPAKVSAPVISIQDRIREQAIQQSEELDQAIDSWITDPESFDPKAFKVTNLLKGKGTKAAHARYIKGFFANGLAELQELASGDAEEQLKENYQKVSRKHVRKLIDFYESITQACEQISAEAKVTKKPRAKKIKPVEEIVKKLKFMITDNKLGVTSVPPAGIIGSQGIVVYNSKTRKIGYYISSSSAGLGVKNSSVTGFTNKSFQKTLRKPETQMKEFKEHNTQRRFEVWFEKNVKTTETLLNGRFSEDTILLKVFK